MYIDWCYTHWICLYNILIIGMIVQLWIFYYFIFTALNGTGSLLQAVENPVKLSREQTSVLEAVQSGRNIFFTGSAGTGKSFLLRRIIGKLKEYVFKVAPKEQRKCFLQQLMSIYTLPFVQKCWL